VTGSSGGPAGPSAEAAAGALRWRILCDGPLEGIRNMAVDHALARERRPDEATFRIYEWKRPTISFGRNEPARGLYDVEAARREGVRFVRRPTGGRAVLHDRELTYAVVAPLRAWGGLRAAYRSINSALVDGLEALGAGVELARAPDDGPTPLSAGPCFQRPAEGEVVARGRKLVGSAQARVGDSLLQHGSLILGGSQDALARIGPEAAAEAGARPASVAELLGRTPTREELEDALVAGFRRGVGGEWRRDGLTDAERSAAVELEDRYASAEWTWRR